MLRMLVVQATGLLMLARLPEMLPGQSIVAWDDFESCRPCELVTHRVVSLGDVDGPGVIESEGVTVVASRGRGYIVHDLAARRFTLFDGRGAFVRSVGQSGDGPGELRGVAGVSFLDGSRVIVLDSRQRWITFRETGEFLQETPLGDLRVGMFRLVEGDTVAVVAIMDRRPHAVGYPLHLVDVSRGRVLGHFGSRDRRWDMSEPFSDAVVMGEDERLEATVWWGKVGRPHIEQWSLDGAHLRTFTGALEWFPVSRTGNPGGAPWVRMTGFAVDAQDRLWMVTNVPDPRWREVVRGREGGIPRSQSSHFWDSRVDVFDLSGRRHLGYRLWDSSRLRLVEEGGSVMISVVEYEAPLWPRVVLYGIDVNDANPRR